LFPQADGGNGTVFKFLLLCRKRKQRLFSDIPTICIPEFSQGGVSDFEQKRPRHMQRFPTLNSDFHPQGFSEKEFQVLLVTFFRGTDGFISLRCCDPENEK